MRSGVTYSPSIIENNIARMENLALRKGLNFVSIEPRLVRNDRNQTLDVEYVIKRGEKVFVERIDIEGNTTTLDQVVRRQFRTVEGDPFNPREIRQARRAYPRAWASSPMPRLMPNPAPTPMRSSSTSMSKKNPPARSALAQALARQSGSGPECGLFRNQLPGARSGALRSTSPPLPIPRQRAFPLWNRHFWVAI